jgi:hypothetical protein
MQTDYALQGTGIADRFKLMSNLRAGASLDRFRMRVIGYGQSLIPDAQKLTDVHHHKQI